MSLPFLVRRLHGFQKQQCIINSIRSRTTCLHERRPLPPSLRPQQSRRLHSVPIIKDQTEDEALRKDGIPGLFTPEAYDIGWKQYQQFMVDRLNTILANDELRGQWDTKNLLINTARIPDLAPTFNYASMAHNNHFFFDSLSRTQKEIPTTLEKHFNTSFGSVDAMRDTLLSSASGMFGPGFVWLVQEESPNTTHPAVNNNSDRATGNDSSQLHFRILVTYLAGTPYPGAHTRQQGVDMNVQNASSIEEYNKHTKIQNDVGAFGRSSRSARGGMRQISSATTGYDTPGDVRRFGGADVIPVLCVNTWQHCYLHDYGVAGKREYLGRWWERIDWDVVMGRCVERARYQFTT